MCRHGNQFMLWDLVGGEEYRSLPESEFESKVEERTNRGGNLSPDGRLLAVGGTNGVRLLDLVSGRALAILPTGPSGARFDPRGRSLFTYANVVYRWPLRFDQDALHVGPPERLGVAPWDSPTRTGGRAIIGHGVGAAVIDLDTPAGAPRQLNHLAAIYVALSPDGRWAATGNHNGAGAIVWDATDGRLVRKVLADHGSIHVWFRPDGKELVTANIDGLTFWETETWKELRRIPTNGEADVVWDTGGKLMAYTASRYQVELQNAATRRPVATLEAPDDLQVLMMALTPGGDRLAVWSGRPSHTRVRDLRLLRNRLAELGLTGTCRRTAGRRSSIRPRVEVDPGVLAEKK